MKNLKRIQDAIIAHDLDAVLLIDPLNRYYAAGFHTSDGAVLITREKGYYITDSRYIEAAHNALDGLVEVILNDRAHPIGKILRELVSDCKIEKLGAEDGSLTYQQYLAYERILGLKLVPAQNLIMSLRQIKQPEELEYMKAAQAITDQALKEVLPLIRPGVTEREIAAELTYRQLRLGAEGNSFDPIVVTGSHSSMPHGVPGDRKIEMGDFITMDFGCLKGGYCSDMTRTVALGSVTDEMKKVYNIVLEAQLAGIAIAKAGVTGAEIDGAARDLIASYGYGEYFGHGFGHSLGLYIHEAPNCAPNNREPMPEHAVCSAEPGIYLPGRFGVRIEDVMHLTADGAEVLTKSPKELIIL